ncbi:TonB-dependent siderophore receptor [Pseudomonas aeruginosa]|nr:TonB-dependent siderophore receptor [Pseudomonas aeruginosa]
MPTAHAVSPLARALGSLGANKMSRLGLALLLVSAQAVAQEYEFNVPAQRLDAALQALGRQAGLQVLYNPSDLSGLRSRSVSGKLELEQAISQLLDGANGIGFELQGKTLILRLQDSSSVISLDSMVVSGLALNPTTENSGSYASPAVSIGKGNKSIKEIPQSVTVVTQKRMQDQNMSTVSDVLANAPGVTSIPMFGTGEQYYSRGFFIENFQYDGVPLERQSYARGSDFSGQTAIFDRVEILRGAQGLLEGGGNPSGSVNFVRKRPTAENQVRQTAKAGSWDHYGTQADISGPIDEQGRLRGRLVLDYDTKNSFVDHVGDDRQTIYAALDYDLTEATRLGFGFSRERIDANIDVNGLPNYTDGSMPHFSRSTFLGGDWSYWDKIQETFYFDIAHQFNEDWSLNATVVNAREKNDYKYLLMAGSINPDNTSTLRGDAYVFDFFSEHWGGDVYVNGRTKVADRQLNLTFGANYSDLDSSDTFGWRQRYVPNWDIFNSPVNTNKPSDDDIYSVRRSDDGYASIQKGVYGMGQYYLTDDLSVVLGTRISSYQKAYTSNGPWGYSKAVAKESAKAIPYAGIIYDLNPEWSAYASFTKIFLPQSVRTASGSILGPKSGKSVETGLKGILNDGRLNATFALFRMEQDNIPIQDANLPDEVQEANCGGTCYHGGGKAISRGFETELSGELFDNVQVYAAYTLNLLRYQGEVPSEADDVGASVNTPKHIFRSWVDYRLPGNWSRVSVGGGVNAQSRSAGFGYYGREQSGFAVWNSRLAYRFTEELTGAMNVNNIFDRRYFKSVDYGHNYFGDPRNVLFTLTYSY